MGVPSTPLCSGCFEHPCACAVEVAPVRSVTVELPSGLYDQLTVRAGTGTVAEMIIDVLTVCCTADSDYTGRHQNVVFPPPEPQRGPTGGTDPQ